MKRLMSYLGIAIFSVFLIEGCGPSEEEIRQKERARRDSLERVRIQRLDAARMDSLVRMQAVQEQEVVAAEEKRREIKFDSNGRLTVQVGSWRSMEKAERLAADWRNKGFDQAYVVKYGNDGSGDVWYRVRLGNLRASADAKALVEIVKADFQSDAWVDLAREKKADDSATTDSE